MKVMVMVKASQNSEAGELPSQELLTEMGKFNQQLLDAGIMLAGEGLHPSSKGVRIKFSGSTRSVTDGPFTETKELLAGYWLWRVKSMEEAIQWVKRCPNPHPEDCEIEIRPVFEMEDFAENLTPELLEQEASMRAQNEGLGVPRFENGRELLLAGISQHYTLETKSGIPDLWHRFAPSIGKVPGQVGMTTYGVSSNSKPDSSFDYLCGVEVSATTVLPTGFTHMKLTPQRYIVFTHSKHISEIGSTLETIWTKWWPDSGLKSPGAPCVERYTEEFNPQTGFGGTEIWVPIQR